MQADRAKKARLAKERQTEELAVSISCNSNRRAATELLCSANLERNGPNLSSLKRTWSVSSRKTQLSHTLKRSVCPSLCCLGAQLMQVNAARAAGAFARLPAHSLLPLSDKYFSRNGIPTRRELAPLATLSAWESNFSCHFSICCGCTLISGCFSDMASFSGNQDDNHVAAIRLALSVLLFEDLAVRSWKLAQQL